MKLRRIHNKTKSLTMSGQNLELMCSSDCSIVFTIVDLERYFWLIDILIDILIYWLIDSFIDWLIDWLIDV